MNKKLAIQTIIQLIIWLVLMATDYAITGHVLVGGPLGAALGLLFVVWYNLK